MKIESLDVRLVDIPFRVEFRHASAARSQTQGIWVEARSDGGHVGCGESCPREYVTNEDTASAVAFFNRHRIELGERITGLSELRTWMAEHQEAIDANPAAWCAIELALLDLMARYTDQSTEALLGLAEIDGEFRYTAVLGDAGSEIFRAQLTKYYELGFRDFKVKLSGDLTRDREKMLAIRSAGSPVRVRVDANNHWSVPEEAVNHLAALESELFAVEEPLQPGCFKDLAGVAEALGTRIILDESFTHVGQVPLFVDVGSQWIVNVRVSKLGGILRSLEVIDQLRPTGIQIIIGAQVGETSLLTRAALLIANCSRDILVAQEGAFGTRLLERDVCTPALMFGAGGVLVSRAQLTPKAPGFGLDFTGASSCTREV